MGLLFEILHCYKGGSRLRKGILHPEDPRVYSHTLGIYGCADLMGGFLKKFAPVMGAFLGT